jgi:hypothetical protein
MTVFGTSRLARAAARRGDRALGGRDFAELARVEVDLAEGPRRARPARVRRGNREEIAGGSGLRWTPQPARPVSSTEGLFSSMCSWFAAAHAMFVFRASGTRSAVWLVVSLTAIGDHGRVETAAPILVGVFLLFTVLVVLGLFVWAARKDGERTGRCKSVSASAVRRGWVPRSRADKLRCSRLCEECWRGWRMSGSLGPRCNRFSRHAKRALKVRLACLRGLNAWGERHSGETRRCAPALLLDL